MRYTLHTRILGLSAAALIAAAGFAAGHSEPFHADAAALADGLGDAWKAWTREDAPALRRALDEVSRNCRRLDSDETKVWPAEVVTWDLAFHRDLDYARELASRAMLEPVYDRLVFLPRGCRGCHASAAKAGVTGVPKSPASSASPADSGSPTPPSASKP